MIFSKATSGLQGPDTHVHSPLKAATRGAKEDVQDQIGSVNFQAPQIIKVVDAGMMHIFGLHAERDIGLTVLLQNQLAVHRPNHYTYLGPSWA